MAVVLILILASLGLALAFLAGFIWAVRSGQYEDTFTPSMRILTEEQTGAQSRAVGFLETERRSPNRGHPAGHARAGSETGAPPTTRECAQQAQPDPPARRLANEPPK